MSTKQTGVIIDFLRRLFYYQSPYPISTMHNLAITDVATAWKVTNNMPNHTMKIHNVLVELTTDATVINRTARVQLYDNKGQVVWKTQTISVPASTNIYLNCSKFNSSNNSFQNYQDKCLAVDELPFGFYLWIYIDSKQAGDTAYAHVAYTHISR